MDYTKLKNLVCVIYYDSLIFHQSISAVQKDMSSAVWKLFSRVEKASEKATCKTCGKEYVCKGGTTSNLINHLKSKHKELFEQYLDETKAKATPAKKRPAEESIQPKMKQRKLHDCIPESDEALNSAIQEAIIDFLADAGVAFNVVGLDSFKKLMEIANRRIKLKHPATYSKMVKVKAVGVVGEPR